MSLPSKVLFYKFGEKEPVASEFINVGWFYDEKREIELLLPMLENKEFDYIYVYDRYLTDDDITERCKYYLADTRQLSVDLGGLGEYNKLIIDNIDLNEADILNLVMKESNGQTNPYFIIDRIKFFKNKL